MLVSLLWLWLCELWDLVSVDSRLSHFLNSEGGPSALSMWSILDNLNKRVGIYILLWLLTFFDCFSGSAVWGNTVTVLGVTVLVSLPNNISPWLKARGTHIKVCNFFRVWVPMKLIKSFQTTLRGSKLYKMRSVVALQQCWLLYSRINSL